MARKSNGHAYSGVGRSDRRQELLRLIQRLARNRGQDRVFADFIELSCLALSNAADKSQFDVRESRYHEIRKGYSHEEFERFPKMFGLLTLAMEDVAASGSLDDVLGGLYMELGLGNARSGQLFTPYHVPRMMALMVVGDAGAVREQGFVDFAEPACGAGGMVIAMADTLKQVGVNYQQYLHATCIDIDLRCVHITYLQASLLHIPAIVLHGNSLTTEVWGRWFTPAHVMGGWSQWLATRRRARAIQAHLRQATEAAPDAMEDSGPAPATSPTAGEALRDQMRLF